MAPLRPLALPAYLIGFALVLIPPFDAIMQVLPLRLGDARWRFGTFGLLSNAMLIPLTGLLIIFVASSIFEQRRFQRVMGILALIMAVTTLAGLGVFALDALQVRNSVAQQAALAFKVATATAGLKATFGMLTLTAFGIASFRGPKPSRATTPKAANLITGRPAAKSTGTALPDSSAEAIDNPM